MGTTTSLFVCLHPIIFQADCWIPLSTVVNIRLLPTPVWLERLIAVQLLNLLDKSDYNLNQTGYFIENDKTKEIIDQLRDDDTSTLLLTALSGMGKSKLIYEAFKETEREPNRYYTS